MAESVSINGLTLCHKNSSGFVQSTLPDVCKSPATPVPYTNTAFAATLVDGTTNVFSNGGAMCGVLGSRFATSIGDEPGVGGGVVSGVNMASASFISFSPNVFMQGRPVTRLTDKMLLNNANTVSAGGYFTDRVAATPLLDEICDIACTCAAAGTANEACVDAGLTAVHMITNSPQNGVFPEARYVNQGGSYQLATDPTTGMPLRGGPFRHPDVTRVANGNVAEIVEVKFTVNGDRYRGNQRDVYNRIAEDNGVDLETVNFPDDCTCEDQPKPVPVPVPVPAAEPESIPEKLGHWASDHPVEAGLVGAAAVIGIGAAVFFTGGAALPALAAAF